jgi:hypothetical protein
MTVPVQETGLGLYRAAIPLKGRENISLRLRDRETDQMQVLHYDRPWPVEYNLSQKLPTVLQDLDSFAASDIRATLVPQRFRRPVAHLFCFASLIAFLASGLIRRL